MRFFFSFAGWTFLGFVEDVLTKTIRYHYLHADITPESVIRGWLAVGCMLLFGVLSLWFLYRNVGKIAFKWCNSPFPARGEVLMGALFLPGTLVLGGIALGEVVGIVRGGGVPPFALGALWLVVALYLALSALQLHSLISDARLVRRLGWTQIEQMEGARLREEGAGC